MTSQEFDQVYNEHYYSVASYVSGLLRSNSGIVHDNLDVADIANTAFLKLVKDWEKVVKEKRKGWLFTVARNHVYNHCRKKKVEYKYRDSYHVDTVSDCLPYNNGNVDGAKNHSKAIMSETSPTGLEKILEQEDLENLGDSLELVRSIVNNLSKRQRKIIELRFFKNLSHTEIGKHLKCSDKASAVLLHTAIKKLKAIFKFKNYVRENNHIVTCA